MTLRQSTLSVATKFCVCGAVAAGLALAGCSETVESNPANKAVQQKAAEEGVDQTAKNKAGKTTGVPIKAKSVKGLIKKNAEE